MKNQIILTPENFYTEIYTIPFKIGMNLCGNNFKLLLEAYRRKHFLNADNKSLGLGFPSYYKSDLFEASFKLTPRIINWFKLTKKGEEKLKLLEEIISIQKENSSKINQMIFEWN